MKTLLKKIVPKRILNLRHFWYAWYGNKKYNNPSEKLIVIGVTGTSGKSTTCFFLRQLLESCGHTVGVLSTIEFYIAGQQKLNDKKMTMLGKMEIHRQMNEMVKAGCDIAIIETTSEGVVQHRHRFINFDIGVLTNLYPEHIESHGSFEKYKNAKLSFFNYLSAQKRKTVCNKKIEKGVVINSNLEHAKEFFEVPVEKKIIFGNIHQKNYIAGKSAIDQELMVDNILAGKQGLKFTINEKEFISNLYGEHNAYNIAAAVGVLKMFKIDWKIMQESVRTLEGPPGRLEFIQEAKEKGFDVIVDYAFEPVALEALYKVVKLLAPKRVIHVCGSTGGGRDQARRAPIGRTAAEADIVIVTNEDPYDEDPLKIIHDVSRGAEEKGKELEKDLFEIPDRHKAIQKAVHLAKKGDLVLVTGKGSEQGMCVSGGKMVKWDDREEVKKALASIKN